MWNQKKKKEWVQCFFTIGIWNQWLAVESVKSITSFYCPAVPELYGSLKCAFWLLTWKFCLLDDVLLVNSVLCMIADHDLVFGRCRNKEPHSSLGVAAIKNHTPPVFSCVVWLLSGTKMQFTVSWATVRRPNSAFEKSVDIEGWRKFFTMNRQDNPLWVRLCFQLRPGVVQCWLSERSVENARVSMATFTSWCCVEGDASTRWRNTWTFRRSFFLQLRREFYSPVIHSWSVPQHYASLCRLFLHYCLSIHHMQNSAPSWITGVRHLESSFAGFATTWSRSTCTCTSIQILAKFVEWSCESLDVFLARFAVALFGIAIKLVSVRAVALDSSRPMATNLWERGLCWDRERRSGLRALQLMSLAPSSSCHLLHGDNKLSYLSWLGLPKVELPHCWAFQPWNTI